MKNINRLLLFLLLPIIILFSNCSGTLGTIQLYDFELPHKVVESKLVEFLKANPDSQPKGKWEDSANFTRNAMSFMNFYFFYFKSDPEEMIVFSFTSDSTEFDPVYRKAEIGIAATTRYNPEAKILFFYKENKLSDEEKEKVRQRVEKNILNKLGFKYIRSDGWTFWGKPD